MRENEYNKTPPRFSIVIFSPKWTKVGGGGGGGGKVYAFPRTRVSTTELCVSLLPSPPRLHARSQRARRVEAHFDPPPEESFFLPAGIFPRRFRCLLSRANHHSSHETRTHPFPFAVRRRKTCYSQMLPANSLKTRPTKAFNPFACNRSSTQREREREREIYLFSPLRLFKTSFRFRFGKFVKNEKNANFFRWNFDGETW